MVDKRLYSLHLFSYKSDDYYASEWLPLLLKTFILLSDILNQLGMNEWMKKWFIWKFLNSTIYE